MKDPITSIDSPNYRAIYDAANYVQTGFKPFDEAWPIVKDYVDYVHIKDATIPDAEHPMGSSSQQDKAPANTQSSLPH